MTGVHGLQHVQRFLAADFADHDAVGPHTQAVDQQLALAHRALAFEVGRAGFEARHVRLLQLQFGRVFDGDDALLGVDEGRQRVEQRGLTGAGSAGDDDVQLGLDGALRAVPSCPASWPCAPPDRAASACRCEKRRIESSGPSTASGGMMALTRDPSLKRASTMGVDSSMRRPTWRTILSMMRSRCWSSRKRDVGQLEQALPLDVDLLVGVHQNVGDGRDPAAAARAAPGRILRPAPRR